MNLECIQQALQVEQVAGWLFYDFRCSNPIAYQVLQLPLEEMYTRRWFYYVPAQGEPCALVSAVESHVLRTLPGKQRIFRSWQELEDHLRAMLPAGASVAMEYSPGNAVPYIARVDAGTIELVRTCGVNVVSSANLTQQFTACLSEAQLASQREAGRRIIAAKDELFEQLRTDLRAGIELDEYSVQQRFQALIQAAGLTIDEGPIVAINAHASNPHYQATAGERSLFRRGDLVLFDFWAHLPEPGSVYADYTWMAFVGTQDEIPARQREVFEIVRTARDAGVAFIRERVRSGQDVEGREVDERVRRVIHEAGYGDYFVHRTGHSITTAEHGDGANLDNLETRDERQLLADTCCSIEPGIYLPEFGVRSELNLLIYDRDIEVTGVPVQEEIVPLL